MRKNFALVVAGALASLAALAAPAHAGVMASLDFDSLTPPANGGGYGFPYSSSTPLPISITSVTRSAGDNALQIQGNVPTKQAWWGIMWGSAWRANSAPADGAPLSSMTLSFDARAVGGTSFLLSVGGYTDDASMANSLQTTVNVTSSWQTYTLTLDTLTADPNNSGAFDPAAGYLAFTALLDQSGFGLTAQTVTVQLDNILLTGPAATINVPEPASLGLLGLGALALLKRRW